MLSLVFCIFLTTSLFVCFKWFDNKQIELLPAIIGNYLSCIIIGMMMNKGGNEILNADQDLIIYSALLGIMFFGIFYSMGYASAKIGVGISSAASKLSLIIPVIFGAIMLNESFDFFRFLALFMAVPAVLLMSYNAEEKWKLSQFSIPMLIFLGSGIIDTSLNLIQKNYKHISSSTPITIIFSSALICSLLVLFLSKNKHNNLFRSILFGVALGVPNYFSVHFMIKALGSGDFTSGQFYLINNTGVMIFSFIMARILFKERLNTLKFIGILLSILSIYLVLYA
jgi:drug/metabolite transporter (DMT)-like permease